MKSCIYEGTIRHRRFAPVKNEFRYRLFLMYLDFSEIKQVFSRQSPMVVRPAQHRLVAP